jgi:hypothetical protein
MKQRAVRAKLVCQKLEDAKQSLNSTIKSVERQVASQAVGGYDYNLARDTAALAQEAFAEGEGTLC